MLVMTRGIVVGADGVALILCYFCIFCTDAFGPHKYCSLHVILIFLVRQPNFTLDCSAVRVGLFCNSSFPSVLLPTVSLVVVVAITPVAMYFGAPVFLAVGCLARMGMQNGDPLITSIGSMGYTPSPRRPQ